MRLLEFEGTSNTWHFFLLFSYLLAQLRIAGTDRRAEVDDAGLIASWWDATSVPWPRPPAGPPGADPRLEVMGLTRKPGFRDVTHGTAGRDRGARGAGGAGRTERWRAASPAPTGGPGAAYVRLARRDYHPRGPRDENRRGLVYLPEDRKRDGLILGFTVSADTTLPVLHASRGWAWCASPPSATRPEEVVERIQLRPPDVDRVRARSRGVTSRRSSWPSGSIPTRAS